MGSTRVCGLVEKDLVGVAMTENLLHYFWKLKNFSSQAMQTTEGEPLRVLACGTHNPDAGPDFLEARIEIGKAQWVGHIELHLRSSDWSKHGHSPDAQYRNVILHVVYEHDKRIVYPSGKHIPTLALKPYLPYPKIAQYREWMRTERRIPCEEQLCSLRSQTLKAWLARVFSERLEEKLHQIAERFDALIGDWEALLFEQLCACFGLRINFSAFQSLARSFPFSVFRKCQRDGDRLAALLYGQAGFLDSDFSDPYPESLRQTYRFLVAKYHLSPLPGSPFRFHRLRPASFPTLRLAQLSALYASQPQLFSKVVEARTQREVRSLFQVPIPPYWRTHYLFDKAAAPREKKLSKSFVQLLYINALLPVSYLYHRLHSSSHRAGALLSPLSQMPPEKNAVIRYFQQSGVKPENATEAQALLQLKKSYCDAKKCLSCGIGREILSR